MGTIHQEVDDAAVMLRKMVIGDSGINQITATNCSELEIFCSGFLSFGQYFFPKVSNG